MESSQEIIVTSCLNDTVVSAYAWDVHTGATLTTYRGDCAVAPLGLNLLAGQYVVAALQDKPFLRVWPVNSQHCLGSVRLVCPGRVTHAQTSPDGCYIALTVAEKLHIYQVASGKLIGSGVRHFQAVRVVRWSRDSTEVVCGGDDGLVTVWPLSTFASTSHQPRLVLSDHTLAVTDLTITHGSRPRLVSVSADHTCKIYDLQVGCLLLSLVFDKILTAVATSALDTEVYVGTDSGAILQFSLLSPPRQLEYHLGAEETTPVYCGHSKAVRSLSVSSSGALLMSGSADGTVKLWPIGGKSQQCIRTLVHKGPVINAFFAPKPKQMFDNELKPSVTLNSFQTANSETSDCIEVVTEQSLILCDESRGQSLCVAPPLEVNTSSADKMKSLQMEIDLLKSINLNLYKFTVDKIISGNTFKPHVPKVVKVEALKVKNNKFKNKKSNSNKSVIPPSSKSINHNSVIVPLNGGPQPKKSRKKRSRGKKENKT